MPSPMCLSEFVWYGADVVYATRLCVDAGFFVWYQFIRSVFPYIVIMSESFFLDIFRFAALLLLY